MSISSFDSSRSIINDIFRSRGLGTSTTNQNAPQQSFAQIIKQLANNLDANLHQQSSSPVSVTGLNGGQLGQVAVSSLGPTGQLSLQGSVIQAAKFATLTVVGNENGTVNAGSYLLSGNTGSTTLEFTQGESLNDVVGKVNQTTKLTGVAATVSGHNLVLTSTLAGSRSTVSLQPIQGGSQTISPVNAAQIGTFQVIDQTSGTSGVVAGNVISSASQANLVYHGATGGTVAGSTTFRLTGANGSTNFAITQGESLSAVADRINQQVTSTGVIASVQGNDLKLSSNITGVAATVQVDDVHTVQQLTTAGINASQVSAVSINSIAADTSHQLTGQVLQTATQAQVTLQGTNTDTVSDTATFQLTGALGTANLSVQQGQALSDVAAQINAQKNSTGVVASVSNHQLVFQSASAGSASNVAVHLTDITHTTVVTGVNSQQLGSFQTNSLTTGASDTLSGTVTQSAAQATATLQGTNADTVVDTATFQLSGSRGSTSLSITQGQALSAVVAQVNSLTNATGVVASVANHKLAFQSTDVGSTANVAVSLTGISHTAVVSGVNSQQLSWFQTDSLATGATDTLSGTVNQAATQAQVKLQGSNSDTVIDSATFQLTGSLGSTSLSIAQGQSLTNVAAQINAQSAATGVVASVASHQLVFKSSDVGSAANVAVKLTNISQTNVVTGVNSQQLSSFQVNSITSGASDSLAGKITQSATAAQLTINGSLGFVNKNASFTLQGSQGSVQISTSKLETLAAFANDINSSTAKTGVIASLSGNTITFSSTGVGSNALVKVSSLSGGLKVNGGDGNGTANGTNAVATINGLTITGTGNLFQYTDTLGSYSFTSASGFTGAISPVTVNSQAGQFSLSGGNGNGTASGTNAVATINGQTLTGTGNTFHYTDAVGAYSFTTASGYTGTISPLSILSQAGQFTVASTNGNGTSNGTDAVAVINGHTLTGTGNSFQYSDAVGSYSFTTASGFTGTISPISILSQAGQFLLGGGNADGTATGTDAVAVINGQTLTGSGDTLHYIENGGDFQIQLAAGFRGAISPITIQSKSDGFQLQGGDSNGAAHGTDLVTVINGVQQSSSNNTVTVHGQSGNYQVSFVNGFVGPFDPVTVTKQAELSTLGADENGLAYGSDGVALIDGQIQTGDGSTFKYSNQGSNVTIEFLPGFQGRFDTVSINDQSTSNSTPNVQADTTQASDNGINSLPVLHLLQQGINQKLIQSQFEQLNNVLHEIQIAEQVMSMSAWTRGAPTAHRTDANSSKDFLQKNSYQGSPASVQVISSPQSSAPRLSIFRIMICDGLKPNPLLFFEQAA